MVYRRQLHDGRLCHSKNGTIIGKWPAAAAAATAAAAAAAMPLYYVYLTDFGGNWYTCSKAHSNKAISYEISRI